MSFLSNIFTGAYLIISMTVIRIISKYRSTKVYKYRIRFVADDDKKIKQILHLYILNSIIITLIHAYDFKYFWSFVITQGKPCLKAFAKILLNTALGTCNTCTFATLFLLF